MKRFTDNILAERIRIVTEDGDPLDVYEILSKHYGESIDLLKTKFTINLDIIRRRIFIEGNMSDICELVQYLYSYDLKFESVTLTSVRIDLDAFFRKIY